jgi:S-adenosylmethionine:tRNA ribosyltransferase-isomerase
MMEKTVFASAPTFAVVLLPMTDAVPAVHRLSDFDYELPPELIAQTPAPERDGSRLLVLDRASGRLEHRRFSDLGAYCRSGDVLVLNDTRVFPCRIPGVKAGGGRAEIFLLEEQGPNLWRALSRGLDRGKRATVADGVEATVQEDLGSGVKLIRFEGVGDIRSLLEKIGRVPLPPYIKREPSAQDRERYQTVYGSQAGAVAAPTAGLHFTDRLLGGLRERGVETVTVTLHVGPGTFQPVRSDDIAQHSMHPERYAVPSASADRINRAKADGRRVIAVGTTAVRTLETAALPDGAVQAGSGVSDIFIRPGHVFRVIVGMVTNFHLPKSTLLMLAAAFAGHERIMQAYRTAVQERYRFYSYGDAMCIL